MFVKHKSQVSDRGAYQNFFCASAPSEVQLLKLRCKGMKGIKKSVPELIGRPQDLSRTTPPRELDACTGRPLDKHTQASRAMHAQADHMTNIRKQVEPCMHIHKIKRNGIRKQLNY